MSIKILSRQEIDDQWWDQQIEQSALPLIYASSWYLDTVAPNAWAAIYCQKTGGLMPFAYKSRMGLLQQAYQPAYTQQLGVFSQDERDYQPDRFVEAIPGRMLLFSTHFNERTIPLEKGKGTWAKYLNLVLPLHLPIDEIRQGYSKSLRKRIRRGRESLEITMSRDPLLVSSFFRQHMQSRLQMGEHHYHLINLIMHIALEREHGLILQANDKNGQVQGACFFLIGFQRIINLFGTTNLETNAMQVILDEVISRYAGTSYFFDFEGSEIPGVANFFRSFGSEARYYYRYDYSPLPGLARWAQNK
jgi:hypothetical protein